MSIAKKRNLADRVGDNMFSPRDYRVDAPDEILAPENRVRLGRPRFEIVDLMLLTRDNVPRSADYMSVTRHEIASPSNVVI
jgi:hypothetical protein